MVVKKDNMEKKIAGYVQYFESIKRIVQERDYELDQLKYAILIREHVLLLGPPGIAKSMIASKVFHGFRGKDGDNKFPKIFDQQFTRFMDENYVFGPQILEEFKKGLIKHNTENSIVDSHFARLDELPNASEELLVSLNEVLNERSFTRQSQKIKAPLITAIITTNQDRSLEKELTAFYDRIMFTSEMGDVQQQHHRISMYRDHLDGKHAEQPIFAFEDLVAVHEDFAKYKPEFTDLVLQQFDSLLTQANQKMNRYISPRTRNKYLNLVKACAYLDNRAAKITNSHLLSLEYALVRGGDGRAKADFQSLVKSISMLKEYEEKFKAISDKYKAKVLPIDISDCAKLKADKLKKDSSVVFKFKALTGAEQALDALRKDLDSMSDKCSIDQMSETIENLKTAIVTEKGNLGFTMEELIKAAEGKT